VAHAKGEIFSGLAADGVAVFNGDDHYAPLWRSLSSHLRRLEFGLGPGVDVAGIDTDPAAGAFTLLYENQRQQVRLPLPGLHNTMNALAAAAVGIALEIDLATITRGLEATAAVPGRLQTRVTDSGVTVVDDTYNANPESLDAALEVVAARGQKRWLVLGDMAELGADAANLHARAGRRARSLGFDRLYALGPLAGGAARAFGRGGADYRELAALCNDLTASLEQNREALTVLVKGSRSMRMERVVAALTETGKAS
jgi:UDP-N-acetylmuramoyl-tripeptide--D-alanyl-D-alanine ligase